VLASKAASAAAALVAAPASSQASGEAPAGTGSPIDGAASLVSVDVPKPRAANTEELSRVKDALQENSKPYQTICHKRILVC
jgi:hypothetical protein